MSEELEIRHCVVIPTYNNAGSLRDVVVRTREIMDTVIVVNDGSTDDIAGALDDLDVVLVEHSENRGKGVALKSGFAKAVELGYSHAVALDADGQHFPDDIPTLIEKSVANPDAVIIGARDMSGVHVPTRSNVGKALSNFWLKAASGQSCDDTQSGFRVYPLKHVMRIFCFTRRFTWECEALTRLAWGGCPVLNVPISVYYPPADERVSHFRPIVDNARFTCLYLFLNLTHLLIPLPHRRLVNREPIWQGSVGATLKGLGGRMRRAFGLPESSELSGGPIRRLRQTAHYLAKEETGSLPLALAVGVGVFIGCTPFLGLHWLIALYAATRLHVNRLATFAGTQISFGPIAVVIALASVSVGKAITGRTFWVPDNLDVSTLTTLVANGFVEWLIGSIFVGLGLALLCGFATNYLVKALRKRGTTEPELVEEAEEMVAESVDPTTLEAEATAA